MSPPVAFPIPARDAILVWYADRGRTLAFRRTTDPYAVLVSESMAQQTQAARAADHWQRFMARFPTVGALAAATSADVLRAWQGLGYNRRALALHRAAKVIERDHEGRVPGTIEALEALPGIGPYTARAVMAIAFGRPVGAVDVNVRRVLGRVIAGDATAIDSRQLQAIADATVPTDRPADWTHAVMDVGATICRARRPLCDDCPARPWCRYTTQGHAQVTKTTTRRRPENAPSTPFPATNRWLRGRILDRLRAVPDDRWVTLDAPIGAHDVTRVRTATTALAKDGLIEIASGPSPGRAGEPLRARLPVA